jgi:hypothetical protein
LPVVTTTVVSVGVAIPVGAAVVVGAVYRPAGDGSENALTPSAFSDATRNRYDEALLRLETTSERLTLVERTNCDLD